MNNYWKTVAIVWISLDILTIPLKVPPEKLAANVKAWWRIFFK